MQWHGASRRLQTSVLAATYALAATACTTSDAERQGGPLSSEAGTGGNDGSASGGRDGATSCVRPSAIDPATWPACAVPDGATPTPVPDGVVLIPSTNPRPPGDARWVGDSLYLAGQDCSCWGFACTFPLRPCVWSVFFVEPCSGVRVLVGGGTSYASQAWQRTYAMEFAAAKDAVFWINQAQDTGSIRAGESALYRAQAGAAEFVEIRGSNPPTDGRMFSALTAHADRLYWVEVDISCDAGNVAPESCVRSPRRLVSASTALTTIPDDALTVLLETADGDASGGFDLLGAVRLAVDATSIYVLSPGALHRVPVGGGPALALADCFTEGATLTTDGDFVYVSARPTALDGGVRPRSIVRVPKAGGACEVLTAASSTRFAVYDGQLYFADAVVDACTTVQRLPLAGGTAQVVLGTSYDAVGSLSVQRDRLMVGLGSYVFPLAPDLDGTLVELTP